MSWLLRKIILSLILAGGVILDIPFQSASMAISFAGVTSALTESYEIPLLSSEDILQKIRQGKEITFLDVREKMEFEKEHIPKAINLNRDMLKAWGSKLLPKDSMVIPYCVKDFRGFAAAADLTGIGFKNIYLMQKRGLAGWKRSGFPVAGKQTEESDATAWNRLKVIAKKSSGFKNKDSTLKKNQIKPSGNVKKFQIKALNFKFVPDEINVNLGDLVVLEIVSSEGNHGVAFPDFGIHSDLPEGREKKLVFLADRVGEFYFGCSLFCGNGHGRMKGVLVVQRPE